MTTIINGKEIAQKLRSELKQEIEQLKLNLGIVPGLAVVQVGTVAASSVRLNSSG